MRFVLLRLLLMYRVSSRSLSFVTRCFGVPSQCRYPITCSEYALIQIQNEASLVRALTRVVRRLLSCHPWSSVSYSPLPEKER